MPQNISGGSVVWDLDLDNDQFNRKLDTSSSKIGGFRSALKSAESGSRMFAGALGLIGGVVGFGVKLGADMEMLRTNLDTLTGSAEKGSKVFRDLNEFGAKTPFQINELAEASRTMLAFGTTAEDLLPTLNMLGDISLGNKEKLSGLTLAFSQVKSQGKLMGQDLLQMVNQGFNPLREISDATGESYESLKDKMSKGLITFEMVEEAMKNATSEGGKFFKGMEKGSQTFSGIWSTFTDNFQIGFRKIIGIGEEGDILEGSIFDKLKNGLIEFNKFLETNGDRIANIFQNMFGGLENNIWLVTGAIIGGLTPAFYGLASGVWATLAPLIPFVVIGGLIGYLINTLIERFGGWSSVMGTIQPYLETFMELAKQIGDILYNVWITAINLLLPPLTSLWGEVKLLLDQLKPLAPLGNFLATVLGVVVVGALYALMGGLYIVIQVVRLFVANFRAGIEGIKSLWSGMPNWIKAIGTGIYETLTYPFSQALSFIGEVVKKIKNLIGKVTGSAGELSKDDFVLKIEDKLNNASNPRIGPVLPSNQDQTFVGPTAPVNINVGAINESSDFIGINELAGFKIQTS